MAVLYGPERLLWASIVAQRAEIARLAFLYDGSLLTESEALLSRSHPAQDSSAAARCGDTNVVAWRDLWTGSPPCGCAASPRPASRSIRRTGSSAASRRSTTGPWD